MNNRFLKMAIAGLVLSISGFANAGIITLGNIQTDDATNYMQDVNTGRLYSRLDATLGRTYEQLTTVDILSGGNWEGWSVATSEVSDNLINALADGTSSCNGAVAFGTVCGSISGWADGKLGLTWHNNTDYYMYISTYTTPNRSVNEAGKTFIGANGTIRDYDDFLPFSSTNWHTSTNQIGYLLYSDSPLPAIDSPPTAINVSEPSSIAILALGLLGFVARRFKKHA